MPQYVLAQNKYLDSLKIELNKKLPDTTLINILLELGDKGAYYDSKQARTYLDQAFALAKAKNLYNSMGGACAYIGSLFYYKDDYDSALEYYRKGISFFQKDTSLDSRLSIATLQSEIADVSVAHGSFTDAVPVYLQAIDTLKRYDPNNHNAIGNLYLAVGSVYRKMLQFDKSLFYDDNGVEELNKDKTAPAAAAFASLFSTSDLISLNRYNEALSSLNQIQLIADSLRSNSLYSQLYNAWGSYYHQIKDLRKAIESYQKALQFAKKANNKFDQVSALRQIGLDYIEMKNYQPGADYLGQALALIRLLGDKHRERSTLKDLAQSEAALHHDHLAVQYYQDYVALSDSLNEQETKKKINEIENRYQAEKRQAEIIALQKNNQLQRLTLQHKNLQIIMLIAGCGLLLVVAALFFVNYKNKNKLHKQNEAIQAQRIHELEQERHLVAVQSLLKGQEEERSRLARDLHDGVGGLLSGVKLSLSTLKGNFILSNSQAQSFENAVNQLDHSISELRRVSHNMMPEALIKFGLKEALENYCESLNLTGKINVTLQIYGLEQRLEQNTEIILYRIIQELLNNVVRHADAKNVLIQLVQEGSRFTLTVEDDGKGFDVNIVKNNNSAGLSNIRARAEYLGGSVDIRSAPGEGTSVYIEGEVNT
jgi:two-component system NarL family sensor kinase